MADDRRESLAEMADIIKVDMQLTSEEQRAELIRRFGPWRCRMLAEKVETQADFLRAREQGFVSFQGYFFRRPEMVTTPDLLGQPSVLRPVFQLMLAHECGEWEAAASVSRELHLDPEEAAGCYWQAQQWARDFIYGGLARYADSARLRMDSCAKTADAALARLGRDE